MSRSETEGPAPENIEGARTDLGGEWCHCALGRMGQRT
ncbi:hypothetical protein SAMN05421539_101287 [Jannaschia seohaensis]|uniref:Uncharacterized protein n=1 Tax=Jannaschia seohaensis TaxID=475081 RepID=A0A2Y9A2Q5_9RHOB|nr:hypothetical protein BCF38_101287 [Jannaschia seohaensis]SSA38156.1 hypothetical protein SAMN05421539_101287 [Jannaschia seohaensis]